MWYTVETSKKRWKSRIRPREYQGGQLSITKKVQSRGVRVSARRQTANINNIGDLPEPGLLSVLVCGQRFQEMIGECTDGHYSEEIDDILG